MASDIQKAMRMVLAEENLSRREAAQELGVQYQQVYRWMEGHRSVPMQVVNHWADTFGMKASEFVALGE